MAMMVMVMMMVMTKVMMMTCNYYAGVDNDEGDDEWGDD